MFCRRNVVPTLTFLIYLNSRTVGGTLSRTLRVSKLNSNNAEATPSYPREIMRNNRIVVDSEATKTTVKYNKLIKKRSWGEITEKENVVVESSGQQDFHKYTDYNTNYEDVVNVTDSDYDYGVTTPQPSGYANPSGGIISITETPIVATSPVVILPCWMTNKTNCTRQLRNPGYMNYFLSEYYTCKTTNFSSGQAGVIASKFVEPPDMSTLKHFLGFRNRLFCTVRWNVASSYAETSIYTTRFQTDYRDPYLYHLCRSLDVRLDLSKDLRRQYYPLSILDGCACAATNAVSKKIVTEAMCCCLPRAFEYALVRMQEVTQIKAPSSDSMKTTGKLLHITFMSFVILKLLF